MGLNEKRAIKEFEEKQFPDLKKRILDALGFEVAIDVKWDTLAKNLNVDLYKEAVPDVYFEPAIQTFKDICADDLGKEALKAVLKSIVIQDENDIYSASQWMKLEEGVLTLDHESCVNHGAIDDRVWYLKDMLEKVL